MLRDAYGSNYDRLVALKTQFDPANLFRMNLNIPQPPLRLSKSDTRRSIDDAIVTYFA
jgi:Berberine and berberine like